MKHRAKQRKPPKIRTKRAVTSGLNKGQRICSQCGKVFELAPDHRRTTYVIPSLWDGSGDTSDTAYICSPRCRQAWMKEHRTKPIVHAPDRPTPQPKNSAPMDSMFD